ncbi:GMC oxidoreductase [Mycetocola zhadangensis]|uniref:GMC oxidoreductase n=1 Tax=Mycetocola zhadangensis TaxID=1164595 RepID=UPI003A4E2E0B
MLGPSGRPGVFMTRDGDARPSPDSVDCCVVGAGPVGLAFALEAAEAGQSVLVLEAGSEASGRKVAPGRPDSADIILNPDRHAPTAQVVRQGLGGTSALWGGRCVAFEPIDFVQREYVPHSGWPITINDVRPWEAAAADYLDCGEAQFHSDVDQPSGSRDFSMAHLERWSRQPKLQGRLGSRVMNHPRITVLFQAVVVDIDFGTGGEVRHLVIQGGGRTQTIRATNYVLAMGGLETTRLLLKVQRSHPTWFGGVGGPLGRYYMGHAKGRVADVVFSAPGRAEQFDFYRDADGTYVRRRITLSETAQQREKMLNTSFHIDNPPFYQVEHRNATLSLVYLGLAIAPIGRLLLAEGIRLRHIGTGPRRIGAHIVNFLRSPLTAASDVIDVIRHRYLSVVRKPGFVLRNEARRYALRYHAEQIPNPDSRLSLDRGSRLSIDYRYTEQDIESVLRCHQLLDDWLRSAGIGYLDYFAASEDEVRDAIWEQANDGFHSIGTTRMSAEPSDGVVDADLQVHGSSNLYVASSSVFRTAGEANPTFLATCLAVRLAHHLARKNAPSRVGTAPNASEC